MGKGFISGWLVPPDSREWRQDTPNPEVPKLFSFLRMTAHFTPQIHKDLFPFLV